MSLQKFANALRDCCAGFVVGFSALVGASAVNAAITQIGTPSSLFQSTAGAVHSLTNVTVPAGTDRVLIVTASHAGFQDVSTVTFGAFPMIKAAQLAEFAVDSIWFVRLGSSTLPTTATVTATFANPPVASVLPTQSFISAVTYAGVDQSVSVNNAQSAQTPFGTNLSSSLNVTSASGNLVFDIFDGFGSAAVTTTAGVGQTTVHTAAGAITGSGPGFARYSTSVKSGAAPTTTTSWTSNSGAMIHAAVNIIAGASAAADLSITATDGVTTATPGGSVTYTITASNAGPNNVTGATVADTFPASLTCTWTCAGAGGGTCTASGAGNINQSVNLPVGGSVTYTASCAVSPSAIGTLSNTATITPPTGVNDPTPGNNSATDTNTLAAQADLSITKTDGVTTVNAGASVTYTITASNAGPSNASGATVADTFPASISGVNWTCVGAGGGSCAASGSGNINQSVNLPAGGSVTFTATGTLSALATGSLSNTATVAAPGGVTDPSPGNNSATDTDTIIALPNLSINDVSLDEGNAGTTNFTFTVSLSAPAGPGGVTFNIATADGTAIAGVDYVAQSLTGQTIPAGSSTYSFTVQVNGDTTVEANETFFVNVTSVIGATVTDGQGQGTIQNDDVAITQIHDIQGSGLTSPLNGMTVTTEGIVTALKFNNGFFLQTADAEADADPNTSQGIFVFTSSAPPAAAAIGNRVRVTGTVTEFTPSNDANQLSITEIVSPSVVVLSTGNPLPAPVVLTSADFSTASLPGTVEKYEGMRVSISNARVVEPSDGSITESSANASTTGVFHVVLDGIARPFREPGIGVMDAFPIPVGKTPPVFDTNQERIMVRSRGQVGATALTVNTDATISNLTGVLDYASGTWALLPDVGSGVATGGRSPAAVSDASPGEATIATINVQRFFDEINDSNGAPTLTAAGLDKRLTKTSLAVCDFLKAPDILGVVEIENLRVLGMLADRINSTCSRAPAYVPYLVQGNDAGGINVGYLVSNRVIGTSTRVEVLEVTQFGKKCVAR